MSNKKEKLKEHIKNSKNIKDEHKEQAISKIEEWYLEDKAEGTLAKELLEISKEFAPILEELGFI